MDSFLSLRWNFEIWNFKNGRKMVFGVVLSAAVFALWFLTLSTEINGAICSDI
jgi:hypothetical protein